MKYPIGDLKHAALGGNHTCILDDKGNVGCWGAGTLGQLGDGLAEDRTSPTAVEWP